MEILESLMDSSKDRCQDCRKWRHSLVRRSREQPCTKDNRNKRELQKGNERRKKSVGSLQELNKRRDRRWYCGSLCAANELTRVQLEKKVSQSREKTKGQFTKLGT